MGMNRIFLPTCLAVLMFSLFLPFTVSTAAEKEPPNNAYSLNDLYRLSLDQSEQIRIAREDLDIAQKDKSRALSVLIPRLTAFGSYSTSATDQVMDPDVIPGETYDVKTSSLAWGVRLDQSFTLNGRELSALSISEDNIARSGQDLNSVRESVLLDVAAAYYNALRAQKGWEIAKANVARLERHRDSVRARLKVDDVTKTDMYRAESELSDARANLIEDSNRFILSKSALRTLVTLPKDFTLKESPEKDDEIQNMERESLIQEGLIRRPEIRAAELNQNAAEKSIRVAQGDRWPVLSIEGQYAESADNNDGTMNSISMEYDKDISGYMIAAKLSFTLFDGGLRNAEIGQARSREHQARLALSGLRKKIAFEIEDASLNVSTEQGRLKSLTDKLAFAQQNYNAVSDLFRHGLANSVDMMDANTLLVASERQLSEARYGYRLAVLKLRRATGNLVAEKP